MDLLKTHKRRICNIIKSIYDTDKITDVNYQAHEPKMIIEGGNYFQQSVVGYRYSEYSFYPYYSSYEEVAKFLKGIILEENKNKFFMPMCYLYRNAIELGLKRLIIEDSHLENECALRIVRRKKHSILGLWNSIVDEIKEYANEPEEDTTISDAQNYIQTFHNFDQSFDLFRYPCNENLEVYFQNATKFDVENVSSCFEELCNFLDGVDGMLAQIRDCEAEMLAYYADY